MENEEIKLTIKTKKMEQSDYIYAGVIILFLVFVLITFFNSTNFILSNINKIFAKNITSNNQALDMNRYLLVAKKLNLPVNTQISSTPEPLALLPGATGSTFITQNPIPNVLLIQNDIIPATTSSTVSSNLDKKAITINIVNAAKIANVASALSKHLEIAGFSKITTSSAKNTSTLTTILIKKSKSDYTNSIEDVIKNIYPNVSVKENPEKSNFDVIITIGK